MKAANKFFEILGITFVVVLCVFSSWIFITKGLDFGGDEGAGDDAKANVYYFNNSSSSDPEDLRNYWYDSNNEQQAEELPDFSTAEVHIMEGAQFDGNVTLAVASTNEGTVNGNATFLGDDSENIGTVTGTLTRIYSESISTTRDFTQDATHWTVIATNGAVVNVTNATYNGSTIFSAEDGGSFVYPEAQESLGAGRFSGLDSGSKDDPAIDDALDVDQNNVVRDLSAGPISTDIDEKKITEEKIVQSDAQTKNQENITTNKAEELVNVEQEKNATISAPVIEEKAPVADSKTVEALKNKLLLAVEDKGKVWYVAPNNGIRYEVSTNNSLNLFRKVSLGITNKDLNQIPVAGSSGAVTPLSQRLVGRFLLQVESRGETWYVDQLGYKHRVTSQNILDVASKAVLGVDNEKLEQIPVAN